MRILICLRNHILLGAALTAFNISIAQATNQVVTSCGNDTQLRSKLATLESSGGGTLSFNCGAATIVLSGNTQLPATTHLVVIDGGGKITLSGGNTTRIFTVGKASNLTLENITLENGFTSSGFGGAVYAIGGLQVRNSAFFSNSAPSGGAIYAVQSADISNSEFGGNIATTLGGGAVEFAADFGTYSINNCNFHDNIMTVVSGHDHFGAAIYLAAGSLTVSLTTFTNNLNTQESLGGALHIAANSTAAIFDSTFVGNRAEYGAGIYNLGNADVERSTFNGGIGVGSGGGFYNDQGGQAKLENDTFSGNRGEFGGAVVNVNGSVALTNVTFSGNFASASGAAIYEVSTQPGLTITLKETVMEKSTGAGNCGQASQNTQPIVFSSVNLSDDSSCNIGGGHDSVTLELGALADNGGPTQTLLPSTNSPVIDGASLNDCPTSDQRGYARPVGAGCDLGSVEVITGTPTPAPTATPTATPTTSPSIASAQNITSNLASLVASARKKLPAVPSRSLSKTKRAKITAARKVILAARSTLKAEINQLLKLEQTAGDSIRVVISTFTRTELMSLKKNAVDAIALNEKNRVAANKLWKIVLADIRGL